MEHDQRPLLGCEAAEGGFQLVAVGECGRRVVQAHLGRSDLGHDPSLLLMTCRFAIAGAHQETTEPGVEPVGVTERGELAPGGHERLLGRVLGELRVPQDETRDGIESTDRAARQLRERLPIACHRPFHEVPMHRASHCIATWLVAHGAYVRSRARLVPDSFWVALRSRERTPGGRALSAQATIRSVSSDSDLVISPDSDLVIAARGPGARGDPPDG